MGSPTESVKLRVVSGTPTLVLSACLDPTSLRPSSLVPTMGSDRPLGPMELYQQTLETGSWIKSCFGWHGAGPGTWPSCKDWSVPVAGT